jgi:hypothetical protein
MENDFRNVEQVAIYLSRNKQNVTVLFHTFVVKGDDSMAYSKKQLILIKGIGVVIIVTIIVAKFFIGNTIVDFIKDLFK